VKRETEQPEKDLGRIENGGSRGESGLELLRMAGVLRREMAKSAESVGGSVGSVRNKKFHRGSLRTSQRNSEMFSSPI
jgi:hypothetical protein